jgi:hypothetical protein
MPPAALGRHAGTTCVHSSASLAHTSHDRARSGVRLFWKAARQVLPTLSTNQPCVRHRGYTGTNLIIFFFAHVHGARRMQDAATVELPEAKCCNGCIANASGYGVPAGLQISCLLNELVLNNWLQLSFANTPCPSSISISAQHRGALLIWVHRVLDCHETTPCLRAAYRERLTMNIMIQKDATARCACAFGSRTKVRVLSCFPARRTDSNAVHLIHIAHTSMSKIL